jgi:hypothetical protein
MRAPAASTEPGSARRSCKATERPELDPHPSEPLLARTTRRVLRHPGAFIAAWVVLMITGGVLSLRR